MPILVAASLIFNSMNRDVRLNQDWKFHREEKAVWVPSDAKRVLTSELTHSLAPQERTLAFDGRYLTLVIRSSHSSDFASLSEIKFLGTAGEVRPRLVAWSSEESQGEDGKAMNAFDQNKATFWHSRWTGEGSSAPHVLIFDFSRRAVLTSLILQQRQTGTNAMTKGFEVYQSSTQPALPSIKSSNLVEYRGGAWETVNLPHAARLEDDTAHSYDVFQGIVWYQKTLAPNPGWRGKRVSLQFEGAMQMADIWVNGVHQLRHTGGYLPFELDLTAEAQKRKPIRITVRLDNRDNPNFPPGRPQHALDFTYAGGLYRNVRLRVTPSAHIANVFVSTHNVSAERAEVRVRTSVEGASVPGDIRTQIIDPRGRVVGETHGNDGTLSIQAPKLWDLTIPHLYHAVTTFKCGTHVDVVKTRFGIRALEFDHQRGAFLNGKPIRLEGSNRHMAFPIIGNAASDEAQYREAKRLKSLGLNILRLAHYPQSPAFLDACDELGILVMDPIPGWQFFQNTPEFKQHVLDDVRQTVIRDRNHPCVAIFETCLNETYSAPDSFWKQCSDAAKATFEGAKYFTGGDSYGKQSYDKPLWDVPWTGWDDEKFARPALYKMQKGIDREYGDYEFGGEQSSSRVSRGDGEGALLLQAWNFIWSHNRNRGNPWSFGDLTWEAIDTHRGLNPTAPVSKSGMLDLFRLPKPVAFFYQSQGAEQSMVHIANGWSPRPSPTKVVVFSNCDEVELRLNGKVLARQKPDHGPTTGYIGPKVADPLYWAKGDGTIVPATENQQVVGGAEGALPFNGGNCEHLSHPPFTFDRVSYEKGVLEAVGFKGGKEACRNSVRTPGKPVQIALTVDTQGKKLTADGADFVFVYASVLDENGQVVPDARPSIELRLSGNARVLGASRRNAEAGIAAFMVQSGTQPGKIVLRALSSGLKTGIATTTSR